MALQNIQQFTTQANKLFTQKKYPQAQKLYEQALKLAPKNQTLAFNLGVVYQVQNQNKKAIKYYNQAGQSPDAKNNLGIIFKKQGDLKKAENYYQAALKIDPKHKDAQANLHLLQSEKVTKQIIAKSPKPSQDKNLITITEIPKQQIEAIRDSFSYQGLVKALDSEIITMDDIKAEAAWEQKNKDLLMDQRVHTVLLADIKNKQVKKVSQSQRSETAKPILLKREKPQKNIPTSPLADLETQIACQITAGWKGLDGQGNFINIISIDDSGWVKFRTFNKTQKTQCLNYPPSKFIDYFKQAKVFEIDPDDFDLIIPEKLSRLTKDQKSELIKKIHIRTLAKFRELKVRKRNLLEKILRRREDKKLTEILARIKA